MTWPPTAPALIAAVLGLIALAMICASQHGHGTTNPQDPPDPDGEHP
ncbi:hypothetical protein [Streptomyces sp. BE133]|nr:hypothetical protein [Streptomyces sp. BE133]MEE1812660.1 hypothetical protein [Streptomyces sp. BE133]